MHEVSAAYPSTSWQGRGGIAVQDRITGLISYLCTGTSRRHCHSLQPESMLFELSFACWLTHAHLGANCKPDITGQKHFCQLYIKSSHALCGVTICQLHCTTECKHQKEHECLVACSTYNLYKVLDAWHESAEHTNKKFARQKKQ